MLFTSCSYNLTVVQTEGKAEDVVDTNESFDANADLDATFPFGL